ncbi:MAG: 2-methylisocitrate lyase [Acidobacteria bacterium]|nr:MAG: 2-methylisocitrate lyase [Acidobacteriota bacterium]
MLTQAEKGKIFRALHQQKNAFIIPNPWDIGSARLLAHLGFQALATTSAGFSFSIGQRDNTVTRDQALTHAAQIASATDLPASADLENGFADAPEAIAETIRLASKTGLSGASIEDMKRDGSIYDLQLAADRIRAAAEVVRSLPFDFTLTARCENYLVARPDLNDTIKRLQEYQSAGANVLYAPGLTTKEDIATLVRSVDRPVNVVMGLKGVQLSAAELSDVGVKRISVGSALSRAALGAFLRAAQEMKDHGTFSFAKDAVSTKDLNSIF